jgi:hypothetical protein
MDNQRELRRQWQRVIEWRHTIEAAVMSQSKLRELIERASTAAEATFNRTGKISPVGFAIRTDGSQFVFRPAGTLKNNEAASLIRSIFMQQNVVCYVLPTIIVSACPIEASGIILIRVKLSFSLPKIVPA